MRLDKTDKLTDYIWQLQNIPIHIGTLQDALLLVEKANLMLDIYAANNVTIHPKFRGHILKVIEHVELQLKKLGVNS